MKTNTFYSPIHLLESLVIATIIILVTAIATAEAQSNSSRLSNFNSAINGLFTPTAADRFFKAGRDDFQREIDFLNDPERYLDGDLLQIDPEIRKQMQETKTIPDFELDNLQMSE